MFPTIVIFFIAIILMLFLIIALLVRRKSMSFELIITQDNRRGIPNTAGKFRYNMRVGRQGSLKAIKIYNRLISFSPVRTLSEIADPRPFVWYGRTVFGILGPSGSIEDDSIVLIPPPKLTNLDVERWATKQSDLIRSAFASFVAAAKGNPLDTEKLSEYIQKTFNDKWVLQNEGATLNLLSKSDILHRSYKVTYASEIEHSYSLEAKHQDKWSQLMQFAPIILIVILIIGIGISLNAIYQSQASLTKAYSVAQGQMYTYEQAQAYAIGHALAIAHIYGYNYTPSAPAPLPSGNSSGLIP